MNDRPRGFRADKCFEGNGPVVVFRVGAAAPGGGTVKFHLVADATQRTFGVRVESQRTDDVKTGGALVNLLRKHARTAGIGRIAREEASGDIWIPLFTTPGDRPDYWVQLARTSPPEVRFVDPDGTALTRKSSQGTYTKRRAVERGVPQYPPGDGMVDLTAGILAEAMAMAGSRPDEPAADELAPSPTEPPPSPKEPEAEGLPEYQREARDRLARRVKTVRKTVQRLEQEAQKATGWSETERLARLLEANINRVSDGDFELRLDAVEAGGAPAVIALDPERSPGQNLTDLFVKVKRGRRAAVALKEQGAKTAAELAAMTDDLARLRADVLPLAAVNAVLARYRLTSDRQSPPGPARRDATSLPYREISWRPGDGGGGKPVTILVGKAAADSDEMCRRAKSNDYWLHAVGTTGSHVLIPARQLDGSPDVALIRAGAILALHFSKLRADRGGEVYFTRRQHIRKRKGMAPGLWSVEKAETLFFRYEEAELQRLLGGASP